MKRFIMYVGERSNIIALSTIVFYTWFLFFQIPKFESADDYAFYGIVTSIIIIVLVGTCGIFKALKDK